MRKVADVMAAECAGAIAYTTSMPRVSADVLEAADNSRWVEMKVERI